MMVGGSPRGTCGCRLWAVACSALHFSFSDESTLEVITLYTLYKSTPLPLPLLNVIDKRPALISHSLAAGVRVVTTAVGGFRLYACLIYGVLQIINTVRFRLLISS